MHEQTLLPPTTLSHHLTRHYHFTHVAHTLENQLQSKLDQYSKLPSAVSRASGRKRSIHEGLEDVRAEGRALEGDIRELLGQLDELDRDMAAILGSGHLTARGQQSRAHSHQRFRSVIQNCKQEFGTTSGLMKAAIDRVELFHGDKGARDGTCQVNA